MERLAELTGRDVGASVVSELFDRLVLLGHLKPWIPDWWEEIRWVEAEEFARGEEEALGAFWARSMKPIPKKSIGATGFEPAT